jgi:hypothetical protein
MFEILLISEKRNYVLNIKLHVFMYTWTARNTRSIRPVEYVILNQNLKASVRDVFSGRVKYNLDNMCFQEE